MKKITSIFFLFFLLTGCTQNNGTDVADTNNNNISLQNHNVIIVDSEPNIEEKATEDTDEKTNIKQTTNIQAESKDEEEDEKISNPEEDNKTYEELHCPKIISLKDSLGHEDTSGSFHSTFKKDSIEEIIITVIATDPQNKTLYYKHNWGDISKISPGDLTWTTNNTFSINVTDANLGYNNENILISNQDGYPCGGNISTDEFDLGVHFSYDITP